MMVDYDILGAPTLADHDRALLREFRDEILIWTDNKVDISNGTIDRFLAELSNVSNGTGQGDMLDK